ncbi:GNAT family N-acetyltransferase [Streptomyces sp. NPDC056549]|uniref:GNAT family N-acetyltransferase n=1 Tax=Streptomyces sp. NPDC056549 TaxID=3345864 RepID=UPI0036AF27CD
MLFEVELALERFHSRERFAWFVDHWSSNPAFTCVIGYDGTEPVGYAYGAAQTPEKEWWRAYVTETPADPSTYAVAELMVRTAWRKTGTSETLHEALVTGRPEALTVLLVDTTHPKVQATYERGGYKQVGTQKPFDDSLVYAVMLRELGA